MVCILSNYGDVEPLLLAKCSPPKERRWFPTRLNRSKRVNHCASRTLCQANSLLRRAKRCCWTHGASSVTAHGVPARSGMRRSSSTIAATFVAAGRRRFLESASGRDGCRSRRDRGASSKMGCLRGRDNRMSLLLQCVEHGGSPASQTRQALHCGACRVLEHHLLFCKQLTLQMKVLSVLMPQCQR
eukprot:SAG11_NODE_1679_length_4467_cov_5.509844_3_plen_186_part_00